MFFLSLLSVFMVVFSFFFFNDTATTEIYTLSLHDALPISRRPAPRCARGARPPPAVPLPPHRRRRGGRGRRPRNRGLDHQAPRRRLPVARQRPRARAVRAKRDGARRVPAPARGGAWRARGAGDRKSTRLNSSH